MEPVKHRLPMGGFGWWLDMPLSNVNIDIEDQASAAIFDAGEFLLYRGIIIPVQEELNSE